MSMIPFSLVEMCAESMCYNRRAYAPRTRVERIGYEPAQIQVHAARLAEKDAPIGWNGLSTVEGVFER